MTTPNIYYYASRQPLPEQRSLRAGPLSVLYEQGDLRYIKLGEREIVRRIYVAVRDRNWGTVLPVLSGINIRSGADWFEIDYEVENKRGEIDFAWHGKITGDTQGTITFSMDGEARSTFWKNRIGFCVLHPIRECAGTPCNIEKVDGSIEHSQFPRFIAPHQPFIDMKAIEHQVLPDLWAQVAFDGDTFEMEDQRNWIDGSYKTYCTPLRLKYPVEVQKGTRVRQSITLTLRGKVPSTSVTESARDPIMIRLADLPPVPLPQIGLSCASHRQPLTDKEIQRLKGLNLSHLRIDLVLSEPDYPREVQQATDEARDLGVPLEIALIFSANTDHELADLVEGVATIQPKVRYWHVFSSEHKATPEALLRLVKPALLALVPTAKFGAGTNYYFTELNRNRPGVDTAADLLIYSVNPQVHAFDNASLSETCEAIKTTIETAAQFVNGKPLSISPITFKIRINPDATGPENPTPPGELPRRVDARQMSLFGAAWTLGSLKYIAESGSVQHTTYYETTGWLGVMESESGSPLPDKFPSTPGSVFPPYHVLADIGEFAGGQVCPIKSSDTLRVEGILFQNPKTAKSRLLLANWTAEPQQVSLLFGSSGTVWAMDESNVDEASQSPDTFRTRVGEQLGTSLLMRPFAIARIDLEFS